MSDDNITPPADRPQRNIHAHYPNHDAPRVWFLTVGTSSIAVALARQLLEHGDYIVAGLTRSAIGGQGEVNDDLRALQLELEEHSEAGARLRTVAFDIRSTSETQAAISSAVRIFGRLDVLLCCNSEALIGTIEEVTQNARTQSLVNNQFSTNFFGPVNIIKSALPQFRQQRNGHIVLLSGITGHLGTPGLGTFCASQWAIEGYCDSLAYEIAPFNIRMSIVQSTIEVSILTAKITAAPPMPPYSQSENRAPLARQLWGRLLDRLDAASGAIDPNMDPLLVNDGTQRVHGMKPSELLNSNKAVELYPNLPAEFQASLIAETVHALTAIGGHENPPARHIVGFEGIASVKEKLRTVSEELEDFFEVSNAVDL